MAEATRRNFLWLGLGGLVAVAAGGALWMRASAGDAAFETRFMTVDQMKAEGALVVDVRRPDEWQATGVIEGARLVTFADAQDFLSRIGADLAPGQELILVCQSGRRSAAAAAALAGLIPNRIISADGGMQAIIASGYRTVAPQL